MKLQLLVPQWKEDQNIVKFLLNSIEIQQGIDLSEVGVIIINDGSDVILDDNWLNSYSFKIDYYLALHGGVSSTRNKCLQAATADYVMFCDADDMFLNNCGLYLIFEAIKKDIDIYVPTFCEEIYNDSQFTYINHPNDATFVHSKVYRRQFLIDNNIWWNESLTIHEDSYFNYLCRACVDNSRISFGNDAFYLWKYRPDSICRSDPKYILKTFGQMIDSTEALADELIRRGKVENAAQICCNIIYSTYYLMNKDEWNSEENQEYVDKFVERFRPFYKKYNPVAQLTTEQVKKELILKNKNDKFNEGVIFEKFTFSQWLEKYNLS